jgi:predicted AlkP superfamily phosphohydrolase/phosphomutase
VIGGADAPGLEWAFAQCPEFGREIRAFVPAFSHRIVWKTRPKSTDEVCALAVETSAIFEAQVETAIRADRRVDWSALMVHFHNLDGLQHRLWPELELDTTFPLRREWVEPTIRMIRALDSAVGRLLELAAHRGAAVIAVSDHGFGPCRELVNVNGLLCRAGLQRKLSYGTRFRYRLSRLADRLRRWSARREGAGRRSHRSIEGQVGCDWKRTVAFAPFGQLSGCIFVTEEVQGESRERVLAEVIGTLREARHPETDELLFEDAFSIADRYGLDPRREGLPDVMAASSDGYQAQAKWSPFCDRLLKPDPDLPGTHYMDGILAIDAAGIAPRSDLRAELVDVAPTTMALMGLPVPARMRGRVVREACSNDCAVDTGRRRLGRFDAAEAAPSPAVLRYAPGA